jgi:UDP-GlcNAc:undecaprenyl-phosphate GlcNAc-1-phosphate transferase
MLNFEYLLNNFLLKNEFFLSILSVIILYFVNKHRKYISEKINLIDVPDGVIKIHKKNTPLLGGIMLFSSFIIINSYLILFEQLTKTSLIIFLCCGSCLLLGLIDDIYKLSYKYKFLFLIIIFYVFVNLDLNLQIHKLYFSTLKKEFYLNYLNIPFTILCMLLITNALNLMDGIDGLCVLISIIFLTWIIYVFQNYENLYIILITSLIFIFFLNIKKNIFLGDNGSLFLGSFIGLNIIANYNFQIERVNFPVENIFITLMLPGLDMFRVFLIRIMNKKNPFTGDRIHLQHLLLDRGFGNLKILIIFLLLILLPILLNFFTNIKPILIILSYVLFYIILILKLNNSNFLKK